MSSDTLECSGFAECDSIGALAPMLPFESDIDMSLSNYPPYDQIKSKFFSPQG